MNFGLYLKIGGLLVPVLVIATGIWYAALPEPAITKRINTAESALMKEVPENDALTPFVQAPAVNPVEKRSRSAAAFNSSSIPRNQPVQQTRKDAPKKYSNGGGSTPVPISPAAPVAASVSYAGAFSSGASSPAGNYQIPAGGGSVTSSQAEQEFVVPAGARLPASLMDENPNLTPQQAQAMESISEDFLDDIEQQSSEGSSNPPSDTPASEIVANEETWDDARMRADQQYRALYGDAAYNSYSMSAASEALAE